MRFTTELLVLAAQALALPDTLSILDGGSQTALKPAPSLADRPPFVRGRFTISEQDGQICTSYGERQWTGTVDITESKQLFYWFFESRNDPKSDPVIIWLNGGPGGTSMMGLFTENGPCILSTDSTHTNPNKHSWNNNASMLYVDQPAGTGFATLRPGGRVPSSDLEGAVDFEFFLNIFFGKAFHDFSKHSIHFAGESYSGHYLPVYMDHMLKSRHSKSVDAFHGQIRSLILVDAAVDPGAMVLGEYELVCNIEERKPILNATSCNLMAENMPECSRLSRHCRDTMDREICKTASMYCMEHVSSYYVQEQYAGRRSPYNTELPCTNLPFCWDETKGNQTLYLNQTSVKERLGFSSDFVFQPVNLELNTAFTVHGDVFMPTVHELVSVLEDKQYNITVLVLNGNDDFIVNTPGQINMLNDLEWTGQAAWKIARWQNWSSRNGTRQGCWKKTPEAKLVFVGIDHAGHTVPGDQREASESVLRHWIQGWSL